MKSGVECSSDEGVFLGDFDNVEGCANACLEESQCRFFIYDTLEREYCYSEDTTSRDCPEGWVEADYNFYEIISKLNQILNELICELF